MINSSVRAVTVAAILAGVAIVGSAVPSIAGPFDGSWSVTISTRNGECGTNSLFNVLVRNGRVSYGGGADVRVSGSVSDGGAVSVSVRQGQNSANGSGRLRGSSGGGSWSGAGPSGKCSGSWSAARSG